MRIRELLVVLFVLALAAPAHAAGGAPPGATGIEDRLLPASATAAIRIRRATTRSTS
jgi:hypothetical protein